MKRSLVATLIVLGLLATRTTAQATPVTYDFSGVLTNTFNGSNAVTGTFTFDATTATISDWSLSEPVGIFDKADSTAHVAQLAALSPNANFVVLFFTDALANELELLFQTGPLPSFDGSTFYTGGVTVPNGTAASGLMCISPPFTLGTCSQPALSGFSSGAARPAATPAGVPEPASLLLVGTGVVGVGMRRWRNRRTRG